MRFNRVIVVDWSAAAGPKRGRDSIWIGPSDGAPSNPATRAEAEAQLAAAVDRALAAGERLLIGVDIAFGYPSGLARALTGHDAALALWEWLASRMVEAPGNRSNYRAVAAEINARFGGGTPFWGNGARDEVPGLPRLKPALPAGIGAVRAVERLGSGGHLQPKSPWQLAGIGAVGAQTLTAIPVLWRLRARHRGKVAVWPFEEAEAPVVLAEVYCTHVSRAVAAAEALGEAPRDAAQVRILARALQRLSDEGRLAALFAVPVPEAVAREEGWTLGTHHADLLERGGGGAQRPPPPPPG
ncbi:MAG: molybdopterin molybdenumtransferase MoeA, partial [Gemmobacter sp.]